MELSVPYTARAFTPAHADLDNAAGVPARLADENYVASLARIVFYWGYPAVDTFGRTSSWEAMKTSGPGASLGLFPAAPKNRLGYLDDYMPAAQRHVVTPNNDTIYGAGFADLTTDAVVIQTPIDAPPGHYWTIQFVDLFTTVIHQLGSASATPGGKFLLVGPEWKGQKSPGLHRRVALADQYRRRVRAQFRRAHSRSEGKGARRPQPDRHVSASARM